MGPSINTSCKNCSFAIYDNNTQTSCLHNRIQNFGDDVTEAYDEDKEFYVIKRFCNYYRDNAWGYSKNDLEKVEIESANSYCIFVDCNNIDEKAHSITEYIKQITYYENKIDIVLFHDVENFELVKNSVVDIARNCTKLVNISVLSEDKNRFLHDSIKKSKAFFHAIVETSDTAGSDFATKINDFINKDLGRCFIIEYRGVLFINNHIYKAMSHLNELYSYDDIIAKIIDDSYRLDRYVKL